MKIILPTEMQEASKFTTKNRTNVSVDEWLVITHRSQLHCYEKFCSTYRSGKVETLINRKLEIWENIWINPIIGGTNLNYFWDMTDEMLQRRQMQIKGHESNGGSNCIYRFPVERITFYGTYVENVVRLFDA